MKVILNAEASERGRAAREWCRTHLGPGDDLIAVLAMTPVGEFVLAVPPVNGIGDEQELRDNVEAECCQPLRTAGINCEARVVVDSAERALLDIAVVEQADLIVVGKRPHGAIVDAVLNDTAAHIVHNPPCAVVVVPSD
jgi:nucleotide-binding universal stress UspA family protein